MIDNELEELVLLAEQRGETQEAIGKLIEEYDAKKAQDSQTGPNGESKTLGQKEEKSPSTTETTGEDTSSSAEVDPLEKYRKQQELYSLPLLPLKQLELLCQYHSNDLQFEDYK